MRRPFVLTLPVLALLATALVAGAGPREQPDRHGPAGKAGAGKAVPAFDVDAFLKEHDKDRDGNLSRQELPERFRHNFDNLDVNHDGKLSREELLRGAFFLQARRRPSDVLYLMVETSDCDSCCADELQVMYTFLRQLDTNHDGKINPDELQAGRARLIDARVGAIFKDLDTDRDGRISRSEARGQVKRHFGDLDANKDGYIDREELRRAAAEKPSELPGKGARPRPTEKTSSPPERR